MDEVKQNEICVTFFFHEYNVACQQKLHASLLNFVNAFVKSREHKRKFLSLEVLMLLVVI